MVVSRRQLQKGKDQWDCEQLCCNSIQPTVKILSKMMDFMGEGDIVLSNSLGLLSDYLFGMIANAHSKFFSVN